MLCVIYAECIYAVCQLCFVSIMLCVLYAVCHSCYVSFMLSVIYAMCPLCCASFMLCAGNTKGGSITVLLTSCLTGLN